MNKKIIFVLICMGAAAAFFLFPSDEKKINSNLNALADYCSTTGNDKAIAALTKISRAAKLCSDPINVQVQSFDINRDLSRKELTDHILMMKKMLPHTEFTFYDTTILFPEKDRAEVSTTLRLSGKGKNARFTDAYELTIHTDKIDGKWLFSSFKVIEFIEQ